MAVIATLWLAACGRNPFQQDPHHTLSFQIKADIHCSSCTATHVCACVQSGDDVLTQHFASSSESDAASATTAADNLVSSAILGALLGSDRTQLQDESEASHDSAVLSEDDSVVAQTMGDRMSDRSTLMEGSLDTADWTGLDQEAAMSVDGIDDFSWSIVVSHLRFFLLEQVHSLPSQSQCYNLKVVMLDTCVCTWTSCQCYAVCDED